MKPGHGSVIAEQLAGLYRVNAFPWQTVRGCLAGSLGLRFLPPYFLPPYCVRTVGGGSLIKPRYIREMCYPLLPWASGLVAHFHRAGVPWLRFETCAVPFPPRPSPLHEAESSPLPGEAAAELRATTLGDLLGQMTGQDGFQPKNFRRRVASYTAQDLFDEMVVLYRRALSEVRGSAAHEQKCRHPAAAP